jgi:hypothetical protein
MQCVVSSMLHPRRKRPELLGFVRPTLDRPRPSGKQGAIPAADHHESAAKSHRAASEHHGKNDHMKGNEHAMEAQKHSKVASAASDEAHAKSSCAQGAGDRDKASILSTPSFQFVLPLRQNSSEVPQSMPG